MAKRKGVHPLVAAAAFAPTLLGLAPKILDAVNPPETAATTAMARHRGHGRTGGGGTVSGGGVSAGGASFIPACTLPFDSIKEAHPLDGFCSATGAATTAPQAAQNQAKNNFCSSAPPVNVTFDVLRQLQAYANDHSHGISFGDDALLPSDRSVLRNLPTSAGNFSEGEVVRIRAFVIDAHASNVSGGESVNCKQSGAESNDIHIVLGENSQNDDQCTSATAEMSPHFRPATWTPLALTQHNAHVYRFTGQLFFDASHRPCSASGTGSPKRSSIWEIHPVYAVDICTAADNAACKVDSDQNWMSLSQEEGQDPSETRLRLPDELERRIGSLPVEGR